MSQVKILKLKRENNMTDNVIIKYLESLLDTMRLYESSQASIGKGFVEDIISMYDRQKAKIAVLSVENANLKISIEDLKADNSFLTEAVASADAPSPIVSRLIQENNEKHMNIVNDLKAEIERLNVELVGMRGACESYKMHYDNACAEVERLQNEKAKLHKLIPKMIKEAKSEAIREFAERFNSMLAEFDNYDTLHIYEIKDRLDILKEMVGDSDA